MNLTNTEANESLNKNFDPLNMLDNKDNSSQKSNTAEYVSSSSGEVKNKIKDTKQINEAISHVQENRNLVTKKDMANLKKNKYQNIMSNFDTAFILQNKKTGQIVEIRAANSFHACNLIGWRPKNCIVVDTIKAEGIFSQQQNNNAVEPNNEKEIKNTADSSNRVDASLSTDRAATV